MLGLASDGVQRRQAVAMVLAAIEDDIAHTIERVARNEAMSSDGWTPEIAAGSITDFWTAALAEAVYRGVERGCSGAYQASIR